MAAPLSCMPPAPFSDGVTRRKPTRSVPRGFWVSGVGPALSLALLRSPLARVSFGSHQLRVERSMLEETSGGEIRRSTSFRCEGDRLRLPNDAAQQSSITWTTTRRQGMAASLFLLSLGTFSEASMAAPAFLERGMSKYIKKKGLDPLDFYVPTVLLTVDQLDALRTVVLDREYSEDGIEAARNLLRTGPAASFRNDLRAIAQYAEEARPGIGSPRGDAERCLELLSELDSYMKREPSSGRDKMLVTLDAIKEKLDGLLATVPADVMAKAEAIVDSVRPKKVSGPSTVLEPSAVQEEGLASISEQTGLDLVPDGSP